MRCNEEDRHDPQHHHHYHENDDANSESFQESTNISCMEACQAMSSVDGVMCGGLSKYFHHEDSSPYLYSSSSPVGPTSCEYCGRRNTAHCPSNLPREYFSNKGRGDNGGSNRNDSYDNNQDSSVHSNQEDVTCHRPKLFFLKKRPPFATPDGWDPITEYRTDLFEPPSSVEGMGRGWGEVRGQLGKNARGSGTNGGGGENANNNTLVNQSTISGCANSSCGGPDPEVSFSDRSTIASGSNGKARSLSPAQWLRGALHPYMAQQES